MSSMLRQKQAEGFGMIGLHPLFLRTRLSPQARLACLIAAALFISCSAMAQPERRPKLLLIGIDGIRVDVLEDAPTPNLDALSEGGGLSVAAASRKRS